MPAPASAPLTIGEAAVRLGLHRQTVRSAIDRHEIPAVRLGRRWLISAAAVERLASGQPAEPER